MTDQEKEFVKKVNMDKARNKGIICIIVSILSLLTYMIPLLLGEFDFGIIFEMLTLVFVLIARKYMLQYDEIRSKKYTIYAMIPIGWLLIYDIFELLGSVEDIVDIVLFGFHYYYAELFCLVNIVMLIVIHKDLSKAENPIKYRESTDWFYEKLEEKENVRNKDIQ